MEFRKLKANEINVRVQSCYSNKEGTKACATFLLYKDARCDMNILDETVGVENWQRSHELIDGKLYCNVGINFPRADGFDRWVWKQDVGTESNTEKEKGEASDSFKRACVNWGIGRELYTSPKIVLWLEKEDFRLDKNNKPVPNIQLEVDSISYDEANSIEKLVLIDDKNTKRFNFDRSVKETKEKKTKVISKEVLEEQFLEIKDSLLNHGVSIFEDRASAWLKKNALVETLEVNKLNHEELKRLNESMIHLLEQKKARG